MSSSNPTSTTPSSNYSTAHPTPASSTSSPPPTSHSPPTEAQLRAQTEARTAVLASLSSAGHSYSAALQSRATDLHSNAAAIDKQQTALSKESKGLAKENAKLEKEVDKALKGMREFGDVQNWAEMLERDFCVLEETLRLVEGGEGEVLESGGSEWRG